MPTFYHFFRQATIRATGEIVRLDYYASNDNTFSIIFRGDSHPSLILSVYDLTDFCR